MKKKAKQEFTYFIQSENGGPIKIGYTRQDPNQRLKDLQTGSPVKLKLLGAIKGNKEAMLHHKFIEERSHGEWFEPSTKLVDYMNNNIDFTVAVVNTNHLTLEGSPVLLIDSKPNVEDGWFDHVLEHDEDGMGLSYKADEYFGILYSKNCWNPKSKTTYVSYEDWEKSEEGIRLCTLHEQGEWHPTLPIMDEDCYFHSIDLDYIEEGYLDVYPYTDTDVISNFFMYIEDWDFIQKIGINIKNKQMCFMCRPIDIHNSKSNTLTAEETLCRLGSFAALLQYTANSVGWFCYAVYWDTEEHKQKAINLINLGFLPDIATIYFTDGKLKGYDNELEKKGALTMVDDIYFDPTDAPALESWSIHL